MNPEQLQAMMQSMPPDAMNQAMAQMKDMKPDDWERAKQQMASMDSATLAGQAAQAQAQMAGRTQYVLNVRLSYWNATGLLRTTAAGRGRQHTSSGQRTFGKTHRPGGKP
jgi:hypothetical protein